MPWHWLGAAALALASLWALIASGKAAWKPVAIALLLGLGGYFLQAGQRQMQDYSGRSVKPVAVNGPALIAARQSLFDGPHLTNRWMVIADAMVRHGAFGDAAQVLQGAVEKEPHNSEAWLAMGDALYGHAGGFMIPAAEFAYDRADQISLRSGKVPDLVELTLERSGRTAAAKIWSFRRQRINAEDDSRRARLIKPELPEPTMIDVVPAP